MKRIKFSLECKEPKCEWAHIVATNARYFEARIEDVEAILKAHVERHRGKAK